MDGEKQFASDVVREGDPPRQITVDVQGAEELTLVLPGSGNPPERPADPRAFQSMWKLLDEQPIRIPAGGHAEVKARVPWDADGGEIQIELSDPPEGIFIDKASCAERTVAIVLRSDAGKVKPGLKGNLIANGYQKRRETNKEGKTREYRIFLGPLPAISFEVVKPQSLSKNRLPSPRLRGEGLGVRGSRTGS